MTVVTVYDATHDNVQHLPKGQAAGYTTGIGSHIKWTAADWQAHPGAVRIDQDPGAADPTADILDVESGAAPSTTVGGWAKRALASYAHATRPGQRRPAIYMSRSMVTPVCNALKREGVTSGVGLWIADWHGDRARAAAEVTAASGPYPVIGVQYANAGLYDVSVFSQHWLQEVSVAHPDPPKPPAPAGMRITTLPPGTWKPGSPVITVGLGPEGQAIWVTTTTDGKTWSTPARP